MKKKMYLVRNFQYSSKIGLVILFLLPLLVAAQQPLTKDYSFVPPFDFHSGSNKPFAFVSSLIFNPDSTELFISGDFEYQRTVGGYVFESVVSLDFQGNYTTFGRSFGRGSVGYIHFINDTNLVVQVSGHGVNDIYGNIASRYLNYGYNYSQYSVKCASGSPIFLKDGGSLIPNGPDNTGQPCKIIYQNDTFPGSHIIKVDTAGIWDSTWWHTSNWPPNFFQWYDNNRILVFGHFNRFTQYDSTNGINGLCRIFEDGTLDTTFQSPFDANSYGLLSVSQKMRKDGSFFVSGIAKLKNDTTDYFFFKLDSSGKADTAFSQNMILEDTSNFFGEASGVISELSDGRLIIYGNFNKYNGVPCNNIVLTDSAGNLDKRYFLNSRGPDSSKSFAQTSGKGFINRVIEAPNGDIYVGGDFRYWDGQPSQPLIRLHGLSVGLEEETKSKKNKVNFQLYPNPSEGEFNLKFDKKIEKPERFQITNLNGQAVNFEISEKTKNQLKVRLNAPPGVYLVQFDESVKKLILK